MKRYLAGLAAGSWLDLVHFTAVAVLLSRLQDASQFAPNNVSVSMVTPAEEDAPKAYCIIGRGGGDANDTCSPGLPDVTAVRTFAPPLPSSLSVEWAVPKLLAQEGGVACLLP